MSRLNPRIGLENAKEMLAAHEFDANRYPLSALGLKRMAEESWQVDEHGLRPVDLEYLRVLAGGRRGIAALRQVLPVGRDEILNVIEPYLMQLELVRPTAAGRELTERGRLLTEARAQHGSGHPGGGC